MEIKIRKCVMITSQVNTDGQGDNSVNPSHSVTCHERIIHIPTGDSNFHFYGIMLTVDHS